MNMGDMAKSPFFQFLLLFFSLNPSISEPYKVLVSGPLTSSLLVRMCSALQHTLGRGKSEDLRLTRYRFEILDTSRVR